VVYYLDPGRCTLRQVAVIGGKSLPDKEILNQLEIPFGKGITGHVAATGQAVLTGDASHDERYIEDICPALSEICVPLLIDDEVVGVIDCEDPRPDYFDDEHMEILTTVAAMAGARLKIIDEADQISGQAAELQRLNARLEAESAERTRAQQTVSTRESWLKSILENASVEIVLKDTEGRYLAVSRSAMQNRTIIDRGIHEIEDFIGKTAVDVLLPHLAKIYMAADAKVMASGQPFQQEIEEEIDGKPRYVINSKFPLNDEAGNLIGICSLTQDITEQKHAEERLYHSQKMEAIGQLTGGIAHDFNNLLAVIQGNGELLRGQVGPEDKLLSAILRASKRGSELTQRLLAYSSRQSLTPEAVDAAALIAEMSQTLTRTLPENISIEVSASPDLWWITADPGQLENAVLNLALNARDAMPSGGTLRMECENFQLDDDGPNIEQTSDLELVAVDYVVLTVSDTGTGMSKEVQAQAFEPFFTTKEVGSGSGLGLSMIYGFAKQSGGLVTINSALGQGARIKLYLPRAMFGTSDGERTVDDDVPPGKGEIVLVLEDDADVRALIITMLAGLDYQVIDTGDVAQARKVLASGAKVDLVLSDVILPGGESGPEFAETMSATGLNFVFMSGYPAQSANNDTLIDGGWPLLRKPFRRRQLAEALSVILRNEAD
jgi:PAS domain S-box-containing protein